jgi:hypothetical protein
MIEMWEAPHRPAALRTIELKALAFRGISVPVGAGAKGLNGTRCVAAGGHCAHFPTPGLRPAVQKEKSQLLAKHRTVL